MRPDYIRLKDTYILDPDKLKRAKPDMAILHPCPGSTRSLWTWMTTPGARYFQQAANGRFIRMAPDHEDAGPAGVTREVFAMNIDSIQNGYVLDHIQAGASMEIYRLLGLDKLDCSVAIIKNAKSTKLGRRISSRLMSSSTWIWMCWAMWTPASPSPSSRTASGWKKKHPDLPKKLVNVLRCKNPPLHHRLRASAPLRSSCSPIRRSTPTAAPTATQNITDNNQAAACFNTRRLCLYAVYSVTHGLHP